MRSEPNHAPLRFLPPLLRGAISFVILCASTVAGVTAMMPLALLKLCLPLDTVRRRVDPLLNFIVEAWAANNERLMRMAGTIRWEVSGTDQIHRQQWYLVVANHQSWADIFVMHKVFNRRIPILKFFLKRELIWVPFAGLAWWALDFPFMKRHSEQFLREHPERRGEDLTAIRKACEKFSLIPTAVMAFVEGTRFTEAKRDASHSPYRHLLRPKAGGIALALNAMGRYFHSLLDVTIVYPDGVPTFFEFLSGRTSRVIVKVNELPIPGDLLGGNYATDPAFRTRVQNWVNELWAVKDATIETLVEPGTRPPLAALRSGSI